MKLEDHLFSLEEKFWTEGADYYARHLAAAAVMVFPLEEHRVLELTDSSALVTYKATAIRNRNGDNSEPYVARASSAYVRDGSAWRLAFHQQTPIVKAKKTATAAPA